MKSRKVDFPAKKSLSARYDDIYTRLNTLYLADNMIYYCLWKGLNTFQLKMQQESGV